MGIKVLPPEVAAKIAAGEVVERPGSVVKELVENAIDAGARHVRIEVQAGGKRLIRVADDGQGIPADEVPLAFVRHATSKLSTVDDLARVTTLGFRGEALASIAAVSHLTLVSRLRGQEPGTKIRVEGGLQRSLGPAGAPIGTMITVENLFQNVPARLKFLKADATETGYIRQIVANYALIRPGISFSLASNGRQVLQTPGGGDLYQALVSVFGLVVAKQLLPVAPPTTGDSAPIEVTGYVGVPSLHRGRRDQVILFVNHRWIQDRSLGHAVFQAYHTFLPVDRHPVAVLNVELDPTEVDVNVHPTKAEVKFREPNTVFKIVQRAVRTTLVDNAPVPEGGFGLAAPGAFEGHAGDLQRWLHQPDQSEGLTPAQLGFEPPPSPSTDVDHDWSAAGATPVATAAFLGGSSAIPLLRVLGQVQQMYIIAEGPAGLYLIDQHAAHERVLYDRLMTSWEQTAAVSQTLLSSATLDLSPAHIAVLEAERATLERLGFVIEPFGGHTYRLLAVPELLSRGDPAAALLDILEEMAAGAVPMSRAAHERIAVIVCKRASVKGGQTLAIDEMRELVRQLERSEAPRTCPHGRPTMIHLSAGRLAREFGRA
jgi:DNA mismatch repair protein MutL